jgi:transmembrane sensor
MNHNSDTEINYALIGRYLSGEASPAEAIELEQWLSASPYNREQFEYVSRLWGELSQDEQYALPDKEAFFYQIKNSVRKQQSAKVHPLKKTKFWLSIAATTLFIISAAFLFTIFLKHQTEPSVAVISRQTHQQVLRDTLPDGTLAIVNSHSTLAYPARFTNSERSVQLNGQAWFNVTADAFRPFVITIGPIRVKVIGTSFNVRSNTDSIEVAVKTGVVRMINNNDSIILQAGKKGIYNTKAHRFLIENSFRANEIGYATRVFNFENASLQEIAAQLEKAYNITIVFNNDKLKSCTLSSSFDNKSLEYIFQVMAMTLNIQYKIENKTVYISGNSCT